MEVKLAILNRFKKGSKTKTSLCGRLPDERDLNKHLIMWILAQAKLNLKGLPVLIIQNSRKKREAHCILGTMDEETIFVRKLTVYIKYLVVLHLAKGRTECFASTRHFLR